MIRRIKQEHRRHARVNLAVPARLLVSSDEEQQCAVLDVSITGVALSVPTLVARGARCMTSFDIDIHGERRRINALGEAIYTKQIEASKYRLGIRFIDMDGYSQLMLRDLMTI
ncbi:MAG TPA: PilZ domain-containing protein [Noviherbaspirillum sp.]|nr:PilZ domain-containing protein [Noviherbaspirillum sp.]